MSALAPGPCCHGAAPQVQWLRQGEQGQVHTWARPRQPLGAMALTVLVFPGLPLALCSSPRAPLALRTGRIPSEFTSEAWGCWRERTASPSPRACGSESLLEGVGRRGIVQEGWGWGWSMREVREGPLSPALGSASSRDVLLLRRTVSAVGALPPLPLLLRGSGVSHPHPTQGT